MLLVFFAFPSKPDSLLAPDTASVLCFTTDTLLRVTDQLREHRAVAGIVKSIN